MNEFISLADKTLATRLGYKINFDVVRRTININSKKIIIYYLSSLVSNDLVNDILESIYRDNFICNGSIDIENDINIVELKINSGMMAILYFDEDKYKVIDIRKQRLIIRYIIYIINTFTIFFRTIKDKISHSGINHCIINI